MRALGIPELLFVLSILLLFLLPFWRIAKKAGYPGWYGLAAYVPILNVMVLWWFAFARWPNLRNR